MKIGGEEFDSSDRRIPLITSDPVLGKRLQSTQDHEMGFLSGFLKELCVMHGINRFDTIGSKNYSKEFEDVEGCAVGPTGTRLGTEFTEVERRFSAAQATYKIASWSRFMTDNEKIPHVEMVMKLPFFIKDPIELDDGTVLAIGDDVEHVKYGRGKIIRIGAYDEEPKGPFIFVDFGNDIRHELDPTFTHIIKKVDDNEE